MVENGVQGLLKVLCVDALGFCRLERVQAMTKSPKFAFIKARWHAEIVDQAYVGFKNKLEEIDANASVNVFEVPGAFEMPLLAQKLADTGTYDAIVAAALVVDGGIYRHEFVAQAVVSGLMDAALATGVPVLSVSLTPHHFQPSAEHQNFFSHHFEKKGEEAAEAAMQISILQNTITFTARSAA
jgi:6,7-dimethyl-8-ribityllumazine synthase